MDGFGYPRKKKMQRRFVKDASNQQTWQRMIETIILSVAILLLEILFQEMLHLEQPKNDAMKALVLTKQEKLFF